MNELLCSGEFGLCEAELLLQPLHLLHQLLGQACSRNKHCIEMLAPHSTTDYISQYCQYRQTVYTCRGDNALLAHPELTGCACLVWGGSWGEVRGRSGTGGMGDRGWWSPWLPSSPAYSPPPHSPGTQ